jgi:hypothetical protein
MRDGDVGCWWDGVKVARTIAVQDHMSGLDILNRKTKSIKFYCSIIVLSNLTNKNQIMHQRRNNKNIIELEVRISSTKCVVATTQDKKGVTISYDDE